MILRHRTAPVQNSWLVRCDERIGQRSFSNDGVRLKSLLEFHRRGTILGGIGGGLVDTDLTGLSLSCG